MGYNHSTNLVYECPGRHKGTHPDGSARCTLPRLDVATTDKKIMRKIESIIGNPDRLIGHIKQTLDNLESTKNQIFNQLKPLDLEAASIREDMAIINARLEKRQINITDYNSRIDKLEARLLDIDRRKKEADPLKLWTAQQDEEARWRDINIQAYRRILSLLSDGKSPFEWLTDEELEQQGPLVIHSPIGDLIKSPFKLKPIPGVSMYAQPAALAPLGNVLSEELRNFKASMIGIVKSDGGIDIQGNILSRDLNVSPASCPVSDPACFTI